jgi:hypothetical protein
MGEEEVHTGLKMVSVEELIADLKNQAANLPAGASKVALLEEVVRLADSIGDVKQGYDLRHELMSAATLGGRSDILIVAFTWCIAQYDNAPHLFNAWDMLWKYKWFIYDVVDFPDVPKKKIIELMEDMTRRYKEYGSTLNPVYYTRRDIFEAIGEVDLADIEHAKYLRTDRDNLSDCEACVADSDSGYYADKNQWKKSIARLDNVLSGKLKCVRQPLGAYFSVLYPLLRIGNLDLAKHYQSKGARLISNGGVEYLWYYARQLNFWSLIGEMAKAKTNIERWLPEALFAISLDDRFSFIKSCIVFTERLMLDGITSIKIQLPDTIDTPKANGKNKRDVAELREWFYNRAYAIGSAFDRRNETKMYQKLLDEVKPVVKWAKKKYEKG